MSDSQENETPAPAAKPAAKGGGKAVPILLVMNLLASGGGVALQQLRPAAAHAAPAPAEEKQPEKPAVGPIVQIPSIIVNLNEAGSGRYLKVSVELQLVDKTAEKLLEENKTIVRDTLLRSLSNLTIADTQGEESKVKIGTDLIARLNKELGADRIRRVLFTEFVVQ